MGGKDCWLIFRDQGVAVRYLNELAIRECSGKALSMFAGHDPIFRRPHHDGWTYTSGVVVFDRSG